MNNDDVTITIAADSRPAAAAAEILVSAHTIRGDSTATLHRAEATALDTIGARRDQPGVTVQWAVTIRNPDATPDDNPTAGQPPRSTKRLPWQPGRPLPPHSLYATCTATRGHG